MKCRQCGTEIADKALVCYRCGTAVNEAIHKPAELKKTRRPVLVYIVFVILALIALAVMYFR